MPALQTLLQFSEAERPLGERLLKLAAETDRIEGYHEPHAVEIARLAEKLGQRLGLHGPELSALKFAALAHDLGERTMKRDYLLRPGGLTWEEQLDLWRHPIIGEQAAAEAKLPRLTQLLIRWHHEWWNGQGYPDGLAGAAIPLGARILRIVDTYCALLSDRPHRGRLEREQVEQFIADQAGIETDPRVVKEFLALIAEERPAPVIEEPVAQFAPDDYPAIPSASPHDSYDYPTTPPDSYDYPTTPPEAEDHPTTPPAAEEPVVPEMPVTPSVSVWDTARQEADRATLGWQGLSADDANARWPATHDYPTLIEPEPEPEPEAAPEALTASLAVEGHALVPQHEPTPDNIHAHEAAAHEAASSATPAMQPTPVLPLAPALQIVNLSDAPDHFWPVAQWLYDEWWALPGSTINVVSDQLKEHLAGQAVPATLVAVLEGQPVGSISLHERASAERPDLTPCLAALYVRPDVRGRGVATQLLGAAETRLRMLSATRYYMTVPEQTEFFARRGWQVLEPAAGAQTLLVLVKQ